MEPRKSTHNCRSTGLTCSAGSALFGHCPSPTGSPQKGGELSFRLVDDMRSQGHLTHHQIFSDGPVYLSPDTPLPCAIAVTPLSAAEDAILPRLRLAFNQVEAICVNFALRSEGSRPDRLRGTPSAGGSAILHKGTSARPSHRSCGLSSRLCSSIMERG
jgi:hypothetical protein